MSISKKAVKRAGEAFSDPNATPDQIANAESLVNEWRGIHQVAISYLLADLGEVLNDGNECVIAGRIKKLSTIKDKLTRKDSKGNLGSMYDIAGCRIIVENLDKQRHICDSLLQIAACNKEKSSKHDYILNPKDSGYRARHLLFSYEYPGSKFSLSVELQVRTRHQHAWATAVEMYDQAGNDRLKFGEPDSLVADTFFRDTSAYIKSIEEGTDFDRTKMNSSSPDAKIILEILEAASCSLTILGNEPDLSSNEYCLVDFDPDMQTVSLRKLNPENAVDCYFQQEKDPKTQGHNYVLLRGGDLEYLKELYPNYFGDISFFTTLVKDAFA